MIEYFLILVFFLLITLITEKTQHIHLYRTLKERLEIVGFFFIVGILWDSFATWRGHWAYPQGGTLGIKIGLLPIEEYLFSLIVPYFGITMYKFLDSKFRRRSRKR